jgi:hypothetical protein
MVLPRVPRQRFRLTRHVHRCDQDRLPQGRHCRCESCQGQGWWFYRHSVDVGPVLDYLAKVDDATKATAKDLSFFKIDQAGFEDGKWAATKLIANNNTWTVTVPESIASGQYVLRHEIIALHSAGQVNGAQNYPKCKSPAQIYVRLLD